MRNSGHWLWFLCTLLVNSVCCYHVHENLDEEPNPHLEAGQRKGKYFDFVGIPKQVPYGLYPTHEVYQMPYMTQYQPYSPFYKMQKPQYYTITPYMIPVSDEVIQQVGQDPMYQNKLTPPRPALDSESVAICQGKRGQVPSSKSCSTFLNCWDEWAVEQDCPKGLMFSEKGFCDFPYNVDCSKRQQAGSAKAPVCEKDFDTFRSDKDCSEFYVCANSEPYKFQCPGGLFYSTALGVCDYRFRVYCELSASMLPPQSSTRPMDPTPPSTAPGTGADKDTMDHSQASGAVGPNEQIKSVAPDFVVSYESKPYLTPGFVEGQETGWLGPFIAISKRDAIKQLEQIQEMKNSE